MSYFLNHQHVGPPRHAFQNALAPDQFAAVVGTVDKTTEHPIQGSGGDHLQFYLNIGGGSRYQIDVNTLSRDGSEIGVYVANEPLDPPPATTPADQPFGGAPTYGVDREAQLSYAGLGLTDADFAQLSPIRIEASLEAALNQSSFVCAYGLVFDDGGANGKGLHETHFSGRPNQDGAVAVYSQDPASGALKRIWFFFKFSDQSIGG